VALARRKVLVNSNRALKLQKNLSALAEIAPTKSLASARTGNNSVQFKTDLGLDCQVGIISMAPALTVRETNLDVFTGVP
jgi:hypothetical protein